MMVLSRMRKNPLKRVLQVIPDVYQLTSGGANMMLIAEEELTLVDTGFRGSFTQIIDFVHHLGRTVDEIGLIILTHNHFDHAGGLAELGKLTRAKVAIHRDDIDNTDGQLPYPRVIGGLLKASPFATLNSASLVKPEDVDIQLVGGEVFQPLGGLEVIHIPGHTPGSISLFSPQKKLIIVGDALTRGRKNPQLPHKTVSLDPSQAIDSVKKIARLDFDILCFGHGRPLIGGAHSQMLNLVKKIKD
jgi:glyoxylase-like metal-dependent hydrolase (beta-lactamase superfamily II)